MPPFRRLTEPGVVCGGTSAEIIARELKLTLATEADSVGGDLPPASTMPGAALITEGIFTLSRALRYLRRGEPRADDPASRLVRLMLNHDIIDFIVGTRINERNQARTPGGAGVGAKRPSRTRRVCAKRHERN